MALDHNNHIGSSPSPPSPTPRPFSLTPPPPPFLRLNCDAESVYDDLEGPSTERFWFTGGSYPRATMSNPDMALALGDCDRENPLEHPGMPVTSVLFSSMSPKYWSSRSTVLPEQPKGTIVYHDRVKIKNPAEERPESNATSGKFPSVMFTKLGRQESSLHTWRTRRAPWPRIQESQKAPSLEGPSPKTGHRVPSLKETGLQYQPFCIPDLPTNTNPTGYRSASEAYAHAFDAPPVMSDGQCQTHLCSSYVGPIMCGNCNLWFMRISELNAHCLLNHAEPKFSGLPEEPTKEQANCRVFFFKYSLKSLVPSWLRGRHLRKGNRSH